MKESTWVGRPSDTPTVDATSPWPGLAAFREADRAYFKGREAVIEEVVRLVTRSPLTVLFGVSGLGKTSLLRAGIFPSLRQNGILPIYIRLRHTDDLTPLRQQVWDGVAAALEATGVEAAEPEEEGSLWEYFHRREVRFWNERNRLVTPLLVFDQFEEIFTLGRANSEHRERSEAFIAELADLAEARPPATVKARLEAEPEAALQYTLTDRPCKVLLSLREDFLADMTDLSARMPTLGDNTFRLQRMNADEALRVVQVEGLVDAAVARRVVEFVAAPDRDNTAESGPGAIEPALLSVFLRELNLKRQAQGRPTITADLVDGSATRIIADFYHRTMAEPGLGPGVRRLIEEKLLTRSGFRNILAEEEALAEPGVSAADLDRLIALRLLRREDTGRKGQARIELTHDVLTEPIRVSRDERHIREREEQKLAALREFELQERKRADEARRRRWAIVLAVVACVAVSLALFAVYEKNAADRALSTADVDRVLLGDPEPLAYLARAITNSPADDLARAVLYAQLANNVSVTAALEHRGRVANAMFAGSGTRVLTVAQDGGARVWLLPDAGPAARVSDSCCPPFATSVARAAVSEDGSRVVTAAFDGSVRTWDLRQHAATLEGLPPFSALGGVADLQLSADGTRAAIATYDGLVRIWTTGADISVVSFSGASLRPAGAGPPNAAQANRKVQFDSSGTRLLTVIDAEARVWDARTGRHVASALDRLGDVADASFSPDGSRLLAVMASGGVRVWGVADGAQTSPEDAPLTHETATRAVFAPSGGVIATVSPGGLVRLWDASSGALRGAPMPHQRPVFACAFSPDGTRLLTVSEDQAARLWDADTGDPLGSPLRHHAPIGTAAFSPDGTRIVTSSDDELVQVWDARRAVLVATPVPHPDRVFTVGFSPDGTTLLTTAQDGVARVWDAASGSMRAELKGETPIDSAAFSRYGTRIVTKGGRVAQLWEADGRPAPGAAAMRLEGEATAPLWFVATGFTRSGSHVVTVASDGTKALWNAGSGARSSSSSAGKGIVSLAVFNPNGMTLATASEATIAIWETENGQNVATMKHEDVVNGIEFSPDGRYLLTASRDRSARLWNAATGAQIGLLRHDQDVTRAVFSGSGLEVVTTTANGAVRLWDVRGAFDRDEGTQPRNSALNVESRLTVGEPSHGRVFTGGADGAVRAWSARTGVSIGPPLRHAGAISAIAVSQDGSRIATVALDPSGFPEPMARIWDVPVGDARDIGTLRELAVTVAGHRLGADGVLTDLPEQAVALAGLGARRSSPDRMSEKFLRWFLADPSTRTVSPLSTVAPREYVARLLATRSEAARLEAQRAFGWLPSAWPETGAVLTSQ
jgi:WD40 repeat protein